MNIFICLVNVVTLTIFMIFFQQGSVFCNSFDFFLELMSHLNKKKSYNDYSPGEDEGCTQAAVARPPPPPSASRTALLSSVNQ